MAIFNSYVKLPEGKCRCVDLVGHHKLNTRTELIQHPSAARLAACQKISAQILTTSSSLGNQRPTGRQKMKFEKKGFENRRLIIYNDLFGICLGNRKLHSKICIQSGEKPPSTRRAETGLSRLSLALRLSRFARKVMTWFANSSWSQLQLAHHVISSQHCNLASTCINLHQLAFQSRPWRPPSDQACGYLSSKGWWMRGYLVELC